MKTEMIENKVYDFWVIVRGSDFELNGFYTRLDQNLIAAELGLRELLKYAFGQAEIEIKHLEKMAEEPRSLEVA